MENISVSIVFFCAWFSEGLLRAGYFKTGSYTRIRAAMDTVENTYFDLLDNILLATQTEVLDSIGSLKNEFVKLMHKHW